MTNKEQSAVLAISLMAAFADGAKDETFMSGPPKDGHPSPYFGEYPPDFFDFIVIDECHRGGANDESNLARFLTTSRPP